MADRLRWGLLGTARINRAIIPRLKELPRHDLLAVASRDEDRARAYAREWDIPHACASYEALLARDDIDVVFVPLPNSLHTEWTIRAARAGKHVLCEKPLALSLGEVDAIIDVARETGVRVAEGFMYRHHAQTARVMEIVRQGDLGPIRLVRGSFSFRLDRTGDIRWKPGLGGGAIWDIGCYPVSFARLVLGCEPFEAFAAASWHPSGVDVACAALLRFPGDVAALIDCAFNATPRASVDIVGADAALHVPVPYKPHTVERLVLTRGEQRVQIDVKGEPSYSGELEEMARQVLEGAPPVMSLADSRGNVAALVGLHESFAQGRPVAVEGRRA